MYKTILNQHISEVIIDKSRFIAHAIPIKSEAEAKSYIESIKKEHWRATHNVPVYLIGQTYDVQRYSDDGEPSGTAGLPILDMLKKNSVTNICIVVTRYFGGIKLGTGGLVRAYTTSAQSAIKNALVDVQAYRRFICTFDYTLHGKIDYTINQFNTHVSHTDYTDQVTICLYVTHSEADKIKKQLCDIASGQININEEAVYGTVVNGVFKQMEE